MFRIGAAALSSGNQAVISFSISYRTLNRHHCRMKRPQLIDLEFAILLFVVGGGMVYSLFRGVFALLD